ncbi:MAG: hypothetical protein GX447_01845 [Elusimicrobia bacterium]|nr:hypothetical protein [Elusimicrobiota bacterium]
MPKDYFPLKEKTRYEYSYKSTEFDGEAKVFIDILKVSGKADKQVAEARMTFTLRDTSITLYKIKKDKKWVITEDGIVIGGRKEFPLPVKEGIKWDEYPDANEIVSLTDKLSIKAGKFSDCLKVLTKIAGGDAGTAVRYYAPSVGYVFEDYSAEDKTCKVELLSVSKVPDEKKEKEKK